MTQTRSTVSTQRVFPVWISRPEASMYFFFFFFFMYFFTNTYEQCLWATLMNPNQQVLEAE